MLTYADGSALSRSVVGAPGGADGADDPALAGEAAAWRAWFDEHADDVVTSPLGITELRRAAAPLGRAARDRARDLAESLTVVRFYDHYNNRTEKAAINPETGKPWGPPEVAATLSRKELESGPALDTRRVKALVAFMKTLTDARYEHLLK